MLFRSGWLKVLGAQENNLKNIDVSFPLGVMTCVTGVSGSGKSSLVNQILYKRLARDLNRARTIPGKHKGIEGLVCFGSAAGDGSCITPTKYQMARLQMQCGPLFLGNTA